MTVRDGWAPHAGGRRPASAAVVKRATTADGDDAGDVALRRGESGQGRASRMKIGRELMEIRLARRTDGQTDGRTNHADRRMGGGADRRTDVQIRRMDREMDRQTDQADGRADRDGQTDGSDGWRTDRQADGRMDGRMDGWTDGRMDGRMDGWTDGLIRQLTGRRACGQRDR